MKTLSNLFLEIISKRGIYKELGETAENIRTLRFAHKKGKVSVERMREICTKAGYTCTQEEKWSKLPN